MFSHYQQLLGIEYPLPEDGYKGGYVEDIAQGFIKDRAKIYAGTFRRSCRYVYRLFLMRTLSGIKRDLKNFGITFDTWQSERELFSGGDVEKAWMI